MIFDLDGVLVNSMPTHFKAWKAAFEKIAGLDIAERDIYLLEGMRGIELVEKIFEQKKFRDHSLVRKVHDEKSRIFKSIRSSEPF
jgi:beta-phosphoglucomutase-like phosphatase (HAD superfamily)